MAKKKNIQTYEKRRKEQDRQRKQEEKRQRRFNKGNAPSGDEQDTGMGSPAEDTDDELEDGADSGEDNAAQNS